MYKHFPIDFLVLLYNQSMKTNLHEDYVRSIVFGFQDALVSTTGVIAGVAAGGADKQMVILAGLVTIMVEALSMGAGQYLSEKTVHQLDTTGKHTDSLYTGAIYMWASYFVGGLVPLTPIILFALPVASYISIGAALMGLFLVGYMKAKVVGVSPVKSGLEMLVLGGITTAIGLLVGNLLRI
jgi:vacuolar iron transporter family protein